MRIQSKLEIFRTGLSLLVLAVFALSQVQADSLWSKETAVSLFTDHKAKRVGDIITVLVQENNSASRNSSTKTEKRATSVRRSLVSSQAIFRTKFSLIILVMITQFSCPNLRLHRRTNSKAPVRSTIPAA